MIPPRDGRVSATSKKYGRMGMLSKFKPVLPITKILTIPLVTNAQTFFAPILTGGSGPTYTAEATALFARAVVQPTPTRKTLVNNLITTLKTAGIWTKFDALYLAGDDRQFSKLNWITNLYDMIETNGPYFGRNVGFGGDGSSNFLNNGFIPSSAPTPKFSLNSAHMGIWSKTNFNGGVGLNSHDFGVTNAYIRHEPTGAFADIGSNGTTKFTLPNAYPGHIMWSRESSTLARIYINGADISNNDTSTTTALSTSPISMCKHGGVSSYGVNRIAAAHFGSQLTAGEIATLYAALNTYLTAIATVDDKSIKYGVGAHIVPLASTNDVATFDILSKRNLRILRIDAASADDTDATLIPRVTALFNLARTRDVSLLPVFFTPFQWGDRTDNGKYPLGDDAALYAQGYNRMVTFATAFRNEPLLTAIEFSNEINLLMRDVNNQPLYGKGFNAGEYTGAVMHDWAQVMKGMSDAIDFVNTTYGKSIRRVLTTTSTMFGFLDYMLSQGVKFEIVGYHIYEHSGLNLSIYWANAIDQVTGLPIINFNLFKKLGSYGRKVIIGEINASEIYDVTYGNAEADPKTEAGFTSFHEMLLNFATQTDADIEAIIAYELFDEPLKSAPENHFGMMTDTTTAKLPIAILADRAGGYVSAAEMVKLKARPALLTYRSAADRLMQHTAGLSTGQPFGFNVATVGSYRIRRVIPAGVNNNSVLNLVLTYANWWTASSPSVGEYNGPATITVSVGIEYNTNPALKQWAPADSGARYVTGTIGGAASGTIAPGAKADAIVSVPLVNGAIVYYELVSVSCASGWPVGITLQPAGSNYDQYAVGTDLHAGSSGGWANGAPASFSAVRIKALSYARIKGALGIGDSLVKGQGYNPSDASWMDIGLGWTVGASSPAESVPLQKLAQGGDQASIWIAASALRRGLIDWGDYTHILWALGTNDLANGRTIGQLKTDTLACLAVLANYAKPIIPVTLLPRTVSGNVTPPTGAFIADRNTYNSWLYTLVGSYGVKSVYDAAAAVENVPGSVTGTGDNKWKDIQYTVDYIHLSGGLLGTGTPGILGTTSVGGGHSKVGADFSTFNLP